MHLLISNIKYYNLQLASNYNNQSKCFCYAQPKNNPMRFIFHYPIIYFITFLICVFKFELLFLK